MVWWPFINRIPLSKPSTLWLSSFYYTCVHWSHSYKNTSKLLILFFSSNCNTERWIGLWHSRGFVKVRSVSDDSLSATLLGLPTRVGLVYNCIVMAISPKRQTLWVHYPNITSDVLWGVFLEAYELAKQSPRTNLALPTVIENAPDPRPVCWYKNAFKDYKLWR